MIGIVFMSTYFPFDLKRFHLKSFLFKNSIKESWLVDENSILPKGRKENLNLAA